MQRRFNYTNRKKINTKDARFRIDGHGPSLRFEADLALGGYDLAPDGRIFVEAYRGSTASWKRFEFGRVGAPVRPMTGPLAEFGDADGILFRVKVTDSADGAGRLLAKADQIRPAGAPTDRDPARSLLDTRVQSLDGEAWRLDFADGRPLLLVDPKAGGKELAASIPFRTLVGPAILREVLTRFIRIDDADLPDDDPDDPRVRWVAFAERFGDRFPGIEEGNDGDREQWIEDVAAGFARRNSVLDRYLQFVQPEVAP